MLNRVILIGRLTKDPELRYTPNGVAVARFTLAVDRRQAKDREKEADFIDIVVWQKQAENCANYIGKGRLVAVDGRLQIRSYDDSQGIRRKAAEVIAENVRFLDRAKEGGSSYNASHPNHADEGMGSEISFNEDDIPF
ncbi:Single-stranded DNA-binding protein ssb [Pelotomaculum schinkii]|uniref:Single-stranded DNA-binding protein n=1 Tax=Pelotomaculum schinkii TaxID=78350 RepID=A0A4Y7R6C2_9FIRM|nr:MULTISPECIES: single-stranded DNA-binding protein [Pelotomaculum]TEB04160.1 Single-stranded DNA-binding protein ssb [Pelotomaculum schinkii]TEB17824.1 Single-stranded DNA-binding protein ssb [Pelotomaculum sp. FP]